MEAFKDLIDRLHQANYEIDEADLRMIPKQEISLSVDETIKVMRVIEEIEGFDDVESVFSNLTISEEAVAAFE